MTKVQLHYDLVKPLEDHLMDQIARVHGVYGMIRVAVAPSLDKLVVEYDASRLSALEVESVLHRAGLPIVLHV
ncbi:MAG: hypothetical protein WKF37_06980 [Bryobacteraceae bacterium]